MNSEQRLIQILIKHWRQKKNQGMLPVYETFVPEALGDQVWAHCCSFTIDAAKDRHVFVTEHAGSEVVKAIGREIKGQPLVFDQKQFPAMRVLMKAEEAIKISDPVIDEGHFVNEVGAIVKFRSCILPFGRVGKPTHLVLGASWRMF